MRSDVEKHKELARFERATQRTCSNSTLIGRPDREYSRFGEQLREDERLQDVEDLLAGLSGREG
jgi:hypothetical protein